MEMVLGRQRILVLMVSNRPEYPDYDAAAAEQIHVRRELRRQLQRERISRDQLAANVMGSWSGR